jgi:hypothetical protein
MPLRQKQICTSVVIFSFTGASHCADMYPPYEGEPEGLKLTRERIRAEVKYYLEASMSGAASAITAAGIFMLLPLMAFLVTISLGHI